MKILNIILSLLLIAVVISSCKKDEVVQDDPIVIPDPTPYTVVVPDWVSSSIIGDIVHPDENPLTVEGIALGRELFYEKQLSGDNTMSCASCHLQEFNFSDSAQFSVGITGDIGDRQAMAIVNSAWDDLFFWDGRAVSLEDQAFGPVVNPIELNDNWPNVVSKLQADPKYPILFEKAFGTQTIDSVLVTNAIAQFERSMVAFDSDYDKFFYGMEQVYDSSELNGFDLYFGQAECIHCHSGPLLNDPAFRNNGLDETFTDLGLGKVTGLASDDGKFKVTSLRNIAQSGPYMHDGRFETLEEVIGHYNSGVKANSPNLDPEMDHFVDGLDLSEQQISDLIAFLNTFTDNSFLTEPAFSDPNK